MKGGNTKIESYDNVKASFKSLHWQNHVPLRIMFLFVMKKTCLLVKKKLTLAKSVIAQEEPYLKLWDRHLGPIH